jgi:hypothetical protein
MTDPFAVLLKALKETVTALQKKGDLSEPEQRLMDEFQKAIDSYEEGEKKHGE